MSENLTRASSGAVYIALLIFCTLFSPITFHIIFTVFMCLSIYEFSKMTNYKYFYLFAIGGITISILFFLSQIPPVNLLYIASGCVVFNILLLFSLFNNKSFHKYHKTYSHLFLYITLPFILLLSIPNFIKPAKYEIVLAIFIMIWCNDTFAYLVGKSIGKHKLLERVSPKKTIEGFVGGIVFTILASIIISEFYTFFSVTLWIITAIVIALFGTLGDLVESKFKREAGVKDSGNIMPGHGGVLDRLDSVIFVIPFLYILYLIYFYYA
jgi:phosphatidate cytidylyltransferase